MRNLKRLGPVLIEYYVNAAKGGMDRYEVKRKIGQGSFGNVYLTIHRKTRQTLVLKEVKVSRMSCKERQDVAHEVDLLSKLNHRNIVQYVDSFSDNIG